MDIESLILKKLTKNLPKSVINLVEPKKATYFHITPHDKTSYVKARTRYMKPSFLELLEIPDFQPINHVSTKSFYTFGMITSPTGSRIESDCWVQNTEDGSNILVRLNLEGSGCHSLFSGQFVAIRGKNIAGNELLVEKVYSLPIININSAKKGKLHLLVARGPFSKKALESLVKQCPDAIVLLGPLTAFLSEYFDSYEPLLSCLEEMLGQNTTTKIILVPSLGDYNFLKVFPQPAHLSSADRVILVPNPSFFYVNNHLVSAVNLDILTELSRHEFCKESRVENDVLFSGDRLSRLSYHLIFQRSFVPVFPTSHTVAYGAWLNMDITPDILLTTSEIAHFHREAGPSTVLNIGPSNLHFYSVSSRNDGSKYNVAGANVFKTALGE